MTTAEAQREWDRGNADAHNGIRPRRLNAAYLDGHTFAGRISDAIALALFKRATGAGIVVRCLLGHPLRAPRQCATCEAQAEEVAS